MTRSDVVKGHPDYYQDKAAKIAQETPRRLLYQSVHRPRPISWRMRRPRRRRSGSRCSTGSRRWCAEWVPGAPSDRMSRLLRPRRTRALRCVLADPAGLDAGRVCVKTGKTSAQPATAPGWWRASVRISYRRSCDLVADAAGLHHSRCRGLRRLPGAAAAGGHLGGDLQRHAAGGGAALLPGKRPDPEAGREPWSATAATNIFPRSTTTTGCWIRGSCSAALRAVCATRDRPAPLGEGGGHRERHRNRARGARAHEAVRRCRQLPVMRRRPDRRHHR